MSERGTTTEFWLLMFITVLLCFVTYNFAWVRGYRHGRAERDRDWCDSLEKAGLPMSDVTRCQRK